MDPIRPFGTVLALSESDRFVNQLGGEIMRVYKKRESQPIKWLLAIIIFVVALGFTTSDVFGFTVFGRTGGHGGHNNHWNHTNSYTYYHGWGGCGGNDWPDGGGDQYWGGGDNDDDNPDPVPEPGTWLLLSAGLGTALVMMKKKK